MQDNIKHTDPNARKLEARRVRRSGARHPNIAPYSCRTTAPARFHRMGLYCVLGLSLAGLAMLAPVSEARSLQSILAETLVQDPVLIEARAREREAAQLVKQTEAGHLPVLTVTGNQTLMRHEPFPYWDGQRRRTDVSLRGSMNVFSWGAIDAAVQRDQAKHRYYQYRYDDIREDLAQTIAYSYLTALRAQESLSIFQRSLQRHDKIIARLNTIVQYDAGRRSELTQAQSRRLQVSSNIAQSQRTRDLALSRLARYLDHSLKPTDLQDPFLHTTPRQILATYRDDVWQTPAYQSQKAELDSAQQALNASQASRLPALNLEGQLMSDNRHELNLTLSWNIFDQAARHEVARNAQLVTAAQARLDQTALDRQEQAASAETDMRQSYERAAQAKRQITLQQQVVNAYEQQFQIARRSLIEVLDAHNELTAVQLQQSTAVGDFREATLAYLHARASIARWADIPAQAGMVNHGVIQPTVILQQDRPLRQTH